MVRVTPSATGQRPFVFNLLPTSLSADHKKPPTQALPDDVMLLIISFMEVKDILCLRKTCKRFHAMSKLRWVWQNAVKHNVIDKGLPVPGAVPGVAIDLKTYSAEHLEARAVHAAKFHDNWCSPHPRPKRATNFILKTDLPNDEEQQTPEINKVFFLPGSNGELVVTVAGCIITCWEVPLDGSGSYRVAEYVNDKVVEEVVVNEDPNAEAVLAFVSGESEPHGAMTVYALALDRFHGRFEVYSSLRGHRPTVLPLLLMKGDYVLVGDPIITVWFYASPAEFRHMRYFRAGLLKQGEANKILTVKVINRYLLIVREKTLQLDYAPSWKGERTTYDGGRPPMIHLGQPATEAVVYVRRTNLDADEQPDWPAEPVTILMRRSPNGQDVVGQFDVFPRDESSPEAIRLTEQGKCASFVSPCAFPIQWTRLTGVAPSCRNLLVTPSGKGFWLQTHNAISQHTVYPARCLVGFQITSVAENDQSAAEMKRSTEVGGGGVLPSVKGSGFRVGTDAVYSRRCDMSEIIFKKYSVTCMALEDTVGRIVIGDRTGRVEVLDYA